VLILRRVAGRVLVLFCEEYARGAFVSQALAGAGYSVKWVRGVETAHQLAERQRVDALVADARSEDLLGWLVGGWPPPRRSSCWPGPAPAIQHHLPTKSYRLP